MGSVLELSVTLTPAPPGASTDVLAAMSLRCDALGLGPVDGPLANIVTTQERELLRWYLEEYWKWPYDEFATRGRQVEELLGDIGKRLYRAATNTVAANSLIQAWRLSPNAERQVSIISDVPAALSVPWELLHDEQGFLALRTRQPVTILRRLPQRELAAFPIPFDPPLRVLLVTARPEGTAFIDPRSIGRELLEALQDGESLQPVELEFLRPPTVTALRARLSAARRPPIHVLHFDGHGVFNTEMAPGEGTDDRYGQLAFEDDSGRLDVASAETVAQVLQGSGVTLVVLTACQGAVGRSDDAFSSVATRLIRSGVDAVAAMSASILAVSATRYVEGFYRALASGQSVPVAQERARQALHDDPRRHVHRRRRDQEGQPVELRDWWLPHLYQQRELTLQPKARKRRQRRLTEPAKAITVPTPPPRYGFGGRARELLLIERWLLQRRLVVIHGFGGVGKTALAREAADWLARTGMFAATYLHSFEHGGDAVALLSALGRQLDVYTGTYDPTNPTAALGVLRPALRKRRLVLIVDNVESILPNGDSELDAAGRRQLFDLLLALSAVGAGVLVTTRDTTFGDGRMAGGQQVTHLRLVGLEPDDAYALASRLLDDLNIDRRRVPYAPLHEFLVQLDHHPLAIQLVLPALREYSLESIRDDFAALLPRFSDELEAGRNRSLLASLDYSLQRLTDTQRALLLRLHIFEGGAIETGIPALTGMSAAEWAALRQALEQAALITPEQLHVSDEGLTFIRFHPVLTPFLRAHQDEPAKNTSLNTRYINWYYLVATAADSTKKESVDDEHAVTMTVLREMPNFRRTLKLLLERGDVVRALTMGAQLGEWFDRWGWGRERDALRRSLEAITPAAGDRTETLTERDWKLEDARAQNDLARGDFAAARARYEALLARLDAAPEGEQLRRSGTYIQTLYQLAMVLRTGGQFAAAEGKLRDALALAEAPTGDEEQAKTIKAWKPTLFSALGDALVLRENQEQAKTAYTAALNEGGPNLSPAARARLHAQLGSVALHQHLYEDATARFNDALGLFRSLGDRRSEATAWNQLGLVAMAQKRWAEAERCLRESLAIKEEQGDLVDAAGSYSNLAMVAQDSGRYSEAEGWHRRALAIPSLPAPERVVIQINFAGFLIEEVQAGRAARDRLAEAKQIAGEALRIDESLDASLNRVRLLGHLAIIADLEGRVDAAREYRSRERAAATKSEEIRRLVDGTFGKAISLVAALIVQPDENTTAQLDEMLQAFFKDPMTNVPGVIRRIANGERAWDELSEGLNRVEAVIVLRLLETISQLTDTLSPEQALASLPMSVRDALTQGDPTSLTAAVDALSPLERRAAASAVRAIRHSGEHFVERLEPYLRAAAEVALGDNARRGEVERTLLVGHDRRDFREAVRRIWSDERDPEALGQRLNQIDRQLVERILTIIGELEAGLAKLLEQAADMLETMARVALGRSSAREDFLASLPPTPGLENLHLVFRRVLTGERDPVSLTAGLPLPQIAIVRRLLALIEEKHAAAVATVDGVEMLIQEIGAVARGNDTGRAALEEVLADLAAKGSQLPALVRRIWDGERGIETLTKDLNRLDALFVVRLLKLIDPTHESPPASTEPTSAVAEPSNDRETILASLPEQVQDAYQRNDDAALQFALMFRAPQEKEAIWRSIESLRRKEDEAELAVVVDAAAPILQAIAEAALGIDARRSKVEELLPQMESQGIRIRDAVQRIWAGERSVADLTKGMTMTETALISHTLMFVEIEPVLLSIAAVAVGDATSLQSIEKALPGFEAKGLRISPTVRRIWAGERDAAALTEGLRKPSALVVGRILDYVSSIEAQFEPLLRLIARAALGDAASRTMVEEFLPKSTVTMELLDPVRRMWAGERNPDALTRGLTPFIASIVLRSLASVADASIKHEKTET